MNYRLGVLGFLALREQSALKQTTGLDALPLTNISFTFALEQPSSSSTYRCPHSQVTSVFWTNKPPFAGSLVMGASWDYLRA